MRSPQLLWASGVLFVSSVSALQAGGIVVQDQGGVFVVRWNESSYSASLECLEVLRSPGAKYRRLERAAERGQERGELRLFLSGVLSIAETTPGGVQAGFGDAALSDTDLSRLSAGQSDEIDCDSALPLALSRTLGAL